MTPQDEQLIRQSAVPETATLQTLTLAVDDSNSGEQMKGFCDRLKSILPQITIKKDSDSPIEKPAIITGLNNNIAYQATPTGKILSSFLQASVTNPEEHAPVSEPVASVLHQVDLPVLLKLYVANGCPHCPKTMQQLQVLASQNTNIRLRIIDAQGFPESAKKDDVRSVPTVILDDQFRWSGQVDPVEVLTLCVQRNPADLSAASLRQLIEDGNAERVATMMKDSGQVFFAIISLLTHPRWSVRLGAMVTVEYLAEAAPDLAAQLTDRLWQEFGQLSDQVQGDVVHLFGELASDENTRRLQNILEGAFDDSVKEAAAEVLEEM